MPRILGISELTTARQIVIVQTRHPEPYGGGPQHGGPRPALAGGKCSDSMVCGEQRIYAVVVDCGIGFQAPVVDGDRYVVKQSIVAREVKIDDAAELFVVP